MVRKIDDATSRFRFGQIRKFCKAQEYSSWCTERKHQVKCTAGNCPKLKKG